MKKIIILSFIILSPFISLISWALPSCPSGENAYWNNCYGVWEKNGTKYEGVWKNNKRNGLFTVTYPNNDKFVGEYKDGRKNGQGTYTFASGSKYIGKYKDDKMHGQGTYTFASGRKGEGEWKDNKPNGYFIEYYADGSIDREGIFKDGEFQYAQKQSSGSSNSSSKLNKYKEFCEEIGFTPGTEKFGECVLQAMEVE